MNDVSYRVALGGVVSSLCILLLFFTSVMPPLYFVLVMLAGGMISIISVEINNRWGVLTYAVVSTLSLLFILDKEAALVFIVMFGHYPMLKSYLDKIKIKSVKIAVKFAVYNICIAIYVLGTIFILGSTDIIDSSNDFGKYGIWVLIGMLNIMFIGYDVNVGYWTIFYKTKFKKKYLLK